MKSFGFGGRIGELSLQLLNMVTVMINNTKRKSDLARKRRNEFLWFLCYMAVVITFIVMVQS